MKKTLSNSGYSVTLNTSQHIFKSDCLRNLFLFLNKIDVVCLKRSSRSQNEEVNQILNETHFPTSFPTSLDQCPITLDGCDMQEEAKKGVPSTQRLVNDAGQWDVDFIIHCLEKTKCNRSYTENKHSVLFYSATLGDISLLTHVITRLGVDVNTPCRYGRTPLIITAQNGHEDTIRFLVVLGADVNTPSRYGETPLDIARQNGHEDTIRVLVELGADVNQQDECGETLLHRAAFSAQIDIIRLLVDLGADINIPDSYGVSPVSLANHYEQSSFVRQGPYYDTIRVLVELGAYFDPNEEEPVADWPRWQIF